MKITYIAKRSRDGKFFCYDVVAEGIYMNLFLSEGAPVEKIALHVEDHLNNPFPEHRMNDSISVIMETPKVEKKSKPKIPVFPEGKPSMQWKVADMQNYLAAYGIGYSDGDTKKQMLESIREHGLGIEPK